MRISIMAGGSSSRPDTLMQTGPAANLDKTPCKRGGPYVFERLDDPLVLSRMTRSGADVREVELLEALSDVARMKVDAEPLGNDPLEVDPSPAHDAVFLAVRTGLDDLSELGQLLLRQARLGTFGPVVEKAFRPQSVEAMDPVAQRLPSMPPIFAAAPRPIPSRTAASDRSRRLWLTSFDRRASARSAEAE